MQKESLNFLKELVETISPSGFEEEAAKVWQREAKHIADEVMVDLHGNAILVINKGGSPRVMLTGHLDEIGFMVTYIDDNGFLFFSPIGGWDSQIFQGQRVWIKTQKGKITGVIGKKHIHLMSEEDRKKIPEFKDLWIDIGAKSKEETQKIVAIGDPVVLAYTLEELANGLLVARGFDDKVGAFVALESARMLGKLIPKAEIYAVATVQEEIGSRGAYTSTYRIDPKIGIAIDVMYATDYPNMADDQKRVGDLRIGKGPIIVRGPNINPKLFELFLTTAEEKKIPHQIQGIPKGTPTDAEVIQLSRRGVATALIAVSTRYLHTPCELLSSSDLEHTIKLIAHAVAKITEDMDFTPF